MKEERLINERDALSFVTCRLFILPGRYLKVDAHGNGVVDFLPSATFLGQTVRNLLVGVFFVFTNQGKRKAKKEEEEVIYNNTRLS